MELTLLKQHGVAGDPDVLDADDLAQRLWASLDVAEVREGLGAIRPVGGSSQEVEAVVLPFAEALGFQSQRRDLFHRYPVSLRPDWYLPLGDTGILLEIERGKTVTNNMDLLDLWKCHICDEANHLILIVPMTVVRGNGREWVYRRVVTRLTTFFEPGNETNVRSLAILGYAE